MIFQKMRLYKESRSEKEKEGNDIGESKEAWKRYHATILEYGPYDPKTFDKLYNIAPEFIEAHCDEGIWTVERHLRELERIADFHERKGDTWAVEMIRPAVVKIKQEVDRYWEFSEDLSQIKKRISELHFDGIPAEEHKKAVNEMNDH